VCPPGCDRLPGRNTIPEQIAADKSPYYRALEEADLAFKDGQLDLTAMEELLSELLARQLLSVHAAATAAEDAGSGNPRLFH